MWRWTWVANVGQKTGLVDEKKGSTRPGLWDDYQKGCWNCQELRQEQSWREWQWARRDNLQHPSTDERKWKWKLLSRVWLFVTPWIVHGILQTRILEWIAVPFSRGSSQPMDWTQVSCIAGRFLTSWTTREAPWHWMTVRRRGMGGPADDLRFKDVGVEGAV